ncbi:unnamed protein product, partial [Ceratitis capitata]
KKAIIFHHYALAAKNDGKLPLPWVEQTLRQEAQQSANSNGKYVRVFVQQSTDGTTGQSAADSANGFGEGNNNCNSWSYCKNRIICCKP